jgi:N-hydroxyarylamine O-acetyltransferase
MQMRGEWRTLYAFTLDEQYPSDYNMMNYFNSTSPDSAFTKSRMCARPTTIARISLNGLELKIRGPEIVETKLLSEGPEYLEALQTNFGIHLPPDTQFKSNPHNF